MKRRTISDYRLAILGGALALSIGVSAQSKNQVILQKLEDVKTQIVNYDIEHTLDSLDQDKLPKPVSGGVLAGSNISNFIITRNHQPMSSHMRIGGEIGGFLDFSLTKHFGIQPQVIFTAHQNYFKEADGSRNDLWSFGAEIPIYFLGRFGNREKGYIQFGGGIFTHFTFASNVKNIYHNVDKDVPVVATAPKKAAEPTTVVYDYSRLYTLHDNHFGVCATVGYELPFGMQIHMQYKVSLSDIAGFYSEMKGTADADALIYPQSISLMLGYRWR